MKRYLVYSAAFYLVFVVYGSLVPLNFNNIPMDVAWQRFENIRYLNLGIASRADWVANILLFIPLAFLWTGAFSANCRLFKKILLSLCVSLFCLLLCISIEFTQLFFPPRTVSLNDIFAECLGAVIGISAWWFVGDKVTMWLDEWLANSSMNSLDHYLKIYLAGLFFYNVMPLDLTISLVEIYHKWNEGRVILFPFSGLKEAYIENFYEWGSEIVLWIPVPILWQRSSSVEGLFQLLIRVFCAVVAIEFFQLFVYSRVTDVTDIILAMVGGGIGIWLGRFFSVKRYDEKQDFLHFSHARALSIGVIGYFFWCIVLMLVFWYPFDFKWDLNFIKWQFKGFFNIPFYSYYYGTEYRAVTEVFHKTLFFMPLGGILAFVVRNFTYRSWFSYCIFFVLITSAFVIEIGQTLLPEKISSSTDVLLEAVGGQIGFIIGRSFFSNEVTEWFDQGSQKSVEYREKHNKKGHSESRSGMEIENDRKSWRLKRGKFDNEGVMWRSWVILLVGVMISTVCLFIAGKSSSVPYNIRELVGGDYAFFRSFGLSLTAFWCLGFPVWFLLRAIKKKLNAFSCFINGVGLHSFLAWFFIRMTAPMESIHDLVGSPVLVIPAEVEVFFRFFSLFSIFSLALFGSVLCVLAMLRLDKKLSSFFVIGLVISATVLPVFYWVVVIEAATDNLTELMMEEGRSFSVLGFYFYMFLFGGSGSILSVTFVFRRIRLFIWSIILVIISFPLGYALLNWATESIIIKYGQVYSALQFLLSPDRTHFVAGSELFIRFCWVNLILLMLVCFSQFSFWLSLSGRFSGLKK